MSKWILYNHGGSGNHGCEAIVRSLAGLLGEQDLTIYSDAPHEDRKYGLDKRIDFRSSINPYKKFNLHFPRAYFDLKFRHNYILMDVLPYRQIIKRLDRNSFVISIGGDVYCYDDYNKYIELHKLIRKKHPTALLGCSIKEKLLDDKRFRKDMQSYNYISARESLTYNLLKEIGVNNLEMHPDSAFLLPTEYLPLPKAFQQRNTIGINLSPLVVKKDKRGVLVDAVVNCINHFLKYTDCSIALIPHVVWTNNDDRTVLSIILKRVNNLDRVSLIPDCNCKQLKGYISQCRFFVGARTHSTIAAYSSCVPTLAIGYSLKAKGIACDLFGTHENYVLPYYKISDANTLIDHLNWLMSMEDKIRYHLRNIMPGYQKKASQVIADMRRAVGIQS